MEKVKQLEIELEKNELFLFEAYLKSDLKLISELMTQRSNLKSFIIEAQKEIIQKLTKAS